MILRTVVNYVSLIVLVITRVPSIPKDRRMEAKVNKIWRFGHTRKNFSIIVTTASS
jgi:hypothetical protein